MAEYFVAFDTSAEPGERLAPEVRAEISEVAPSTLNDEAVTEQKIAERAVTNPKLGLGAVHTENIGTGEVDTENIADKAVGRSQIDDDAVGPDQVGVGIVTAHDTDGNPVASDTVKMTAAQYEALPSPNPNTRYYIVES